jgi:nitroreductase
MPRPITGRILEAAHNAPTGTGHSSTGVIAIDNPQTLARFSELVFALYENLEAGLKNPIARFFIISRAGAKQVRTLQTFVMPGMHWYIHWYREGKSNEILRDYPTLLLFHNPINEPVAAENCLIAAFNAILMAQVLGIGTCFNDIIPPACNRVPEIRKLLGLPDEREVYASLIMGYPKYRFHHIPPESWPRFAISIRFPRGCQQNFLCHPGARILQNETTERSAPRSGLPTRCALDDTLLQGKDPAFRRSKQHRSPHDQHIRE